MKKYLFAAALVLGIAVVAAGDDRTFIGCTTDSVKAQLIIDVDEPHAIADIQAAFRKTASALDFQTLVGPEGFRLFVSQLSENDIDAIHSLRGAPMAVGQCVSAQ